LKVVISEGYVISETAYIFVYNKKHLFILQLEFVANYSYFLKIKFENPMPSVHVPI